MKVIAFDSWTGGASHYQRLVEPFARRGVELTLIHLGSWGSDVGRPPIEQIGNLSVRDVRYYDRLDFASIIRKEDPAAVMFLSTDTFAHRAFNRYCRHLSVPTVNMFHGLITVQSTGGVRYRVNPVAQARFVARRLVKALTIVWPVYAMAIWRTNGTLDEWMRFASDIFALARGRFPEISASDARTDKCFIFAAADMEYAAKRYGFDKSDIVAVGNPDLLKVGLSSDLIGSQLTHRSDGKDVMYIDTGLVQTGFVFKSLEEFVNHMCHTRDVLQAQGWRLVFKPHPSHLGSTALARLSEAGIDICANEEFVDRLKTCAACIVEPSTLAVIPALMGLPLFLATYGRLQGQPYGTVLTGYPRSVALGSLDDFSDVLADMTTATDLVQTEQWIDQNAGPLPADEMPKRVVDNVLDLIASKTLVETGC